MRHARRNAIGRRRGSTYILILGVSMILMVIGLSAAMVARVNNRSVSSDNDWSEAQTLAFSAAEHALSVIQTTDDWRRKFRSSGMTVDLGRGSFTWRLVDETDGDLDDDSSDPFVIQASGDVDRGAFSVGLNCIVEGGPLPILEACLHAGKEIEVKDARRLTATGGGVSTNYKLKVGRRAVVTGDVEAVKSVDNRGTITGTVTTPADEKELPPDSVFDTYRKMATRIKPGSTIRRQVLAPARNPWGSPNAQGIYFIDEPHKYVYIYDARIHGTLVVRCKKLILSRFVLLHSFRADLPALIVDGDAELSYYSVGAELREGGSNPNFNPTGAPYEGWSDDDRRDRYPSEIRGLVHVKGDLKLSNTALVRGAIICEDKVKIYGFNQIILDPGLKDDPPIGYTTGDGTIIPQAWTRMTK